MSKTWTRVKWTQARQVTAALDWPSGEEAAALDAPPQRYFETLRRGGRETDAVDFLAQALPRWEVVAWAARAVRDIAPPPMGSNQEDAALKAALLWIQDPSEPRRRAAEQAALAAPSDSAARLAALAAFYSGGSIAPAEAEPLPAPREAAGLCAAGAILLAAARAPDMDKALAACLDAGAAIAAGGDGAGR